MIYIYLINSWILRSCIEILTASVTLWNIHCNSLSILYIYIHMYIPFVRERFRVTNRAMISIWVSYLRTHHKGSLNHLKDGVVHFLFPAGDSTAKNISLDGWIENLREWDVGFWPLLFSVGKLLLNIINLFFYRFPRHFGHHLVCAMILF